jgi:hypothetical protein
MDSKEALFRIWTGFIWLRLVIAFDYFEHRSEHSAGPGGRSPAEIVGSNPTGGMDVFLL